MTVDTVLICTVTKTAQPIIHQRIGVKPLELTLMKKEVADKTF